MIYFYTFFFSFLFTIIFTPFVIVFAKKFRILDFPLSPRKLHKNPTPLLGGIAIFASFVILAFFLASQGYILGPEFSSQMFLAVIFGGLILIVGGYVDDTYNLNPRQQFFFHALAVLAILAAGIHIRYITNPFGGVILIPSVIGIIITVFWLFGVMYTTKFLDGLDGLVSGISVIASIIIFIVSLWWDKSQSGTSFLAIILAGAALGFLLFNFHPAKIFLGEGGSLFLGFILGVLSIITGSKIATTFLILCLPVIDTFWVIIERVRMRASPVRGDRRHFHYRLLDSGIEYRKIVLFIYFTTLIFGLSSLLLNTKGKIISIILFITISTLLIKRVYIKKS